VLVWSRGGRIAFWAVFAVIFLVLIVAPLAVIVLASLAGKWDGVLPSHLTFGNLHRALSSDNSASLTTSLQTALIAGIGAVAVGSWAAISAARLPILLRRTVDGFFHLPVAVPSVVVGLGLLVAFSKHPLVLNGTKWIVILAQAMLVLAFAYSTVSAGLARLDPAYAEVAASLGARPGRVLWRIRLPLLLPSIAAAASLSMALCMGEVGATIMVYPASWRTLPVSIFGLADRGNAFLAAADTVVLLITTLIALLVIGRLRGRAHS